jgi:hypothetical protein
MAKPKNTEKPNNKPETTETKPRNGQQSSGGRQRKPMTLSALVNKIATKKDLDATVAGKRTRAYIRRNREALVKAGWKSLDKHEKGNRYEEVPSKVADAIFSALTK